MPINSTLTVPTLQYEEKLKTYLTYELSPYPQCRRNVEGKEINKISIIKQDTLFAVDRGT